jgi:outer membrane protein assembly factor BamE (lipoprotein component of BamABCDE complex)
MKKNRIQSAYLFTNLIALSIIPLLTLSSCSVNQGNNSIKDFGRYSSLQKGNSTKKEIYNTFGQPHDVNAVSSSSRWTYYNLQSSMSGASFIPFIGLIAGGTNDQITTAEFFFTSQGKLQNYSTSEKTKFTNSFVGSVQGIASHLSDNQSNRVQTEMERLALPFDKLEARKARDVGTSIGVQE